MCSVLNLPDHEWEWHRPVLGPSYWSCSIRSVLVTSDILPPLSEIQIRYPSSVQRVLDGLDQLCERKDRSDWEIYFMGISCFYVNHAARALSSNDESLDACILRTQQWDDCKDHSGLVIDKRARMRMEQAYWAYLRSHPSHYNLPGEVVDEALEQLGTSYNMSLFQWDQPVFVPRHEATLWIEMLTAVRDLPEKRLRVYLAASAMHDYSEYCELKKYGPVPSNRPSFLQTLFRFMVVWVIGFTMATWAIALMRPYRKTLNS